MFNTRYNIDYKKPHRLLSVSGAGAQMHEQSTKTKIKTKQLSNYEKVSNPFAQEREK
jgi:hypothetical protein